MKAKLIYHGKTYGNDTNASGYQVSIEHLNQRKLIRVAFSYDKPADGRGVGEQKGAVEAVSLSLTPEAWRAVAHGLHIASSGVAPGAVGFRIDEEMVRPATPAP